MTQDEAEIQRLCNLDDDTLFAELGGHISESALPPTIRELIRKGKTWFKLNRERIAEKICPDARLRQYADKDPGTVDYTLLASMFGDVVAVGGELTLAVLVTRFGLYRLCAHIWREPEDKDKDAVE